MLDLACKYEEQLQKLFANITFDEKYKYLDSSSYRDKYKASDSTWGIHEFVSVYKGKVLGYMKYNISRDSCNANGMQVVNFTEVNLIFSKDLLQFLKDIFEKFKFRKLKFSCVVGNPIEKQYDKLCQKYGGRIVGVYKNDCKLIDGLYYDFKIYEISRDEYLKKMS